MQLSFLNPLWYNRACVRKKDVYNPDFHFAFHFAFHYVFVVKNTKITDLIPYNEIR